MILFQNVCKTKVFTIKYPKNVQNVSLKGAKIGAKISNFIIKCKKASSYRITLPSEIPIY